MRVSIKPFGMIVLAGTLMLLMWAYYAHYHRLTQELLSSRGFPDRVFSDLYPCWLASRELLIHGRDPYSADVTKQIQQGYYGRPIDSQRPTDPIDEQRFAYPLFVVFLLAPTVGLPFSTVKVLFTIILFAAAARTIVLWGETTSLKLGWEQRVALILFSLATIPFAQGVLLQQPSVFVAFLMAAALRSLAKQRLVTAGILLGFSTIKPQLSVPVLVCVLLWAISKWPLRRRVVFSFVLTIAALIAASELLLPDWPMEFVAGIGPYLRYTQATSGVRQLFGPAIGALITALLAGITAFAVWRGRSQPADSNEFVTAVVLVLTFTCVAIPSLAPHNEVLVLPAYLLLARERRRLLEVGRLARSVFYAAIMVAAWPLITGCLLVLALFVFDDARLSRHWDLPLATNPLIPIVVFVSLVPLLGKQYFARTENSPSAATES